MTIEKLKEKIARVVVKEIDIDFSNLSDIDVYVYNTMSSDDSVIVKLTYQFITGGYSFRDVVIANSDLYHEVVEMTYLMVKSDRPWSPSLFNTGIITSIVEMEKI